VGTFGRLFRSFRGSASGRPRICWASWQQGELLANGIKAHRCKEPSISLQTWEEILKQIEQEPDADKIAELAKKLNNAMVTAEREKVKRRLGFSQDRYAN